MQKTNYQSKPVMKYKVLYTFILFLVYMVGKSMPLYGVNWAVYTDVAVDAQKLLLQTVGGDIQQISLFALGISPYMISMLIVQIVNAIRKMNKKVKISAVKSNLVTVLITLILSAVMAVVNVQNLIFIEDFAPLYLMKGIAVVEMITGAVFVLWMMDRNGRYGIGGQTAFICVNVLDGILRMLRKSSLETLILPLLLSLAAVFVMILMENTEMRISMQRISIYNIYAEQNYLAFKLNPIGVMPVMFSSAVFILPKLVVTALMKVFPNNSYVAWGNTNMELIKPLGFGVYIFILFALTIGFALIFLSPSDMSEQFLKSGDCLANIHAGRDTKRYLTRTLLAMSIFSASVMGMCVGIPLIPQMQGIVSSEVAMLPTSMMMLTGICCNLFRELKTIHSYDSYKVIL